MIGVEINGGLGNQMFEYAFAYAEAKKHNTKFFFNKDGMPIELYDYFKLERNIFYYFDNLFFSSSSFKLIFSHYLRKGFYRLIKKQAIKKFINMRNDDDPLNLGHTQDKTFYTGPFQSPIYFKGYEADIRKMFRIKNKIVARYKEKYQHFAGKKIVAIHIRKTDYKDLAHLNLGKADLSLPITYFQKVIEKIHQEDNYYVFVSDDIELIKPHFQYLDNKYFSEDIAINEFLHVFFADTLIISNSTFSWWAAYLNNNPGKVVYCPEFFLGYLVKKEYPSKIYPADWRQLSVE